MTDPFIGTTVGHYDVVAKLGGGGMGVVYQSARQPPGTPGRAQVPARAVEQRRRRQAALHARGAGGVGDRPPEHLHDPRHRPGARRPAVHRDGLLRGRHAEAAARRRPAACRGGPRDRDAGRARPGARAPRGRRAPRHQAQQSDSHRRCREDRGLRPGEVRRLAAPHGLRGPAGHLRLHVARAGPRGRSDGAERRLGGRRRPLRDAGRTPAVPGQLFRGHRACHPPRIARANPGVAAGGARGGGARGLSRDAQGPGRSLRERQGAGAGAPAGARAVGAGGPAIRRRGGAGHTWSAAAGGRLAHGAGPLWPPWRVDRWLSRGPRCGDPAGPPVPAKRSASCRWSTRPATRSWRRTGWR